MAKQQHKPVAVSVGFFILLGMVLFIGGIFFLRTISTQPAYTFKVAYAVPDPLTEGVDVVYRGVTVGQVQSIALADTHDMTLVEVGIANPKLKLDKDVRVKIRLEGITGQRYVEIMPPEEKDEGGEYLQDGDLIAGAENYTWEKIQRQLNEIVEDRTIEKTLNSAQKAMQNLEMASAEARTFIGQVRPEAVSSLRNIRQASHRISTTVENVAPELEHTLVTVSTGVEQFNQNTRELDQTLRSLDTAAVQVDETFGTIDEQLKSTKAIAKVAETSDKVKTGMTFINRSIGATPDINIELTERQKAGRSTVRAFGCTVGRVNYILKQRFLLFKLMFGEPGEDYECPIEQGEAFGSLEENPEPLDTSAE